MAGSVKGLRASEEGAAEEEEKEEEAERTQSGPWMRRDEEKAAEGLCEEYVGMRW